MKKRFRFAVIMTLLVTIVISTSQSIFAAPKFTKEDFYGLFLRYAQSATWRYATETPENCYETKRGIKCGNTKKQVIKKYGKAALKKAAKDIIYKTREAKYGKNDVICKLIRKSKSYLEYICKDNKNEYRMRFYLDKNDKVVLIEYILNYSKIDYNGRIS